MTACLPSLAAACTSGKPATADAKPDPADSGDSGAHDTAPPTSAIHLVYMGSGASGDVGQDTDTHLIYGATSQDGIHFTEDGLLFTSAAGNDPDIFQSETGFTLFTSNGPTLNYATSTGLTTTFTTGTTFAWFGGGGPSTVNIDGVQQVFFCGYGGIKVSALQTEPPGLGAFSDAFDNPHGSGFACDPSVIKISDTDYRMFYHWSPSVEALPWKHVLYAASSTDGKIFTPIDGIIREQASVPGAVFRDGVIYLYAVDGLGGGNPDEDSGHTPGDSAKPDEPTGLLVGISNDLGKTWDFQPVLIDDAEKPNAYDPDPILAP